MPLLKQHLLGCYELLQPIPIVYHAGVSRANCVPMCRIRQAESLAMRKLKYIVEHDTDFSANADVMTDTGFASLLSILTGTTVADELSASALHVDVSHCTKLTHASAQYVKSVNDKHAGPGEQLHVSFNVCTPVRAT